MALVDEVITTYTLKDDYSAKLKQMSSQTQAFDRDVQQAQQSLQKAGGAQGFAGTFLTGGFGGVIGKLGMIGAVLAAVSAGLKGFSNMLSSLHEKLLSVGVEGGPLAQLLTLPGRIVLSINTAIAQFFDTIKSFGLFPIHQIISSILDLPFAATNALIGALARGFEALATVMGRVAQIVGEIGGQILGAFAGIAGKALEIATEFDSLKRSFGALLESTPKGNQLAEFLRTYGMKSPFEQAPLFEAARSIIAAGQSVTRFLPLMERIALLRGGGSENLRDVTTLFTMLFGGATGRVFGPMGLGRFGIGKTQLSEAGAQFSKGGEFLGGVDEAVAVLERLLNQPRFRNLSEMFEESPAVVFSNALDGVNKLLETIGSTLATIVMPYVKVFGETLADIARSEAVRDFLDNFKTALTIEGGPEKFRGFLLDIAAVMLSLPEIIASGWDTLVKGAKAFWGFLTGAWDFMAKLVNSQVDALNRVLTGINRIMAAINGLRAAMGQRPLDFGGGIPLIPHLPSSAELGDLFTKGMEGVGDWMSGFSNIISGKRAQLDKLLGGTGEDPTKDATKSLGSIATNTSEIAKNTRDMLDLSRTALGGGDIGRLGVTPIEMRRVRNPSVVVRGTDKLSMAIQDIIQNFMVDYERQMARSSPGRA